MIAADTNILVYAHRLDSQWHKLASKLISDLAQSRSEWAIPWPCLHEFISVATHPRILSPPSTTAEACAQIDAWRESPSLVVISETNDHWRMLKKLAASARVVGPKIHDARIAALCLQHGVTELWSADRDFSRFGELKTRNPLVD